MGAAAEEVSAQFATSLHYPEHIPTAEQLGYDRAAVRHTARKPRRMELAAPQ